MFEKFLCLMSVIAAVSVEVFAASECEVNGLCALPGGGFTSVKIELPKNWDQLMEKAGYEPLRSFYLKSGLVPSEQPQQLKNYRPRR